MVRETRQLIASQHPGRRPGDVQLHELLGTRYAVQHEKMMPNLTQRRLKNQRKLRLCVRPKRKLNTLHYWLIVQLRYGSLERFNEVQRSISEVAQLMRLTYRTVQYILQRFERDGHQMLCHYKGQAKPWNAKLTPLVKEYLLDHKTLKSWAGFSLKWRCHVLY